MYLHCVEISLWVLTLNERGEDNGKKPEEIVIDDFKKRENLREKRRKKRESEVEEGKERGRQTDRDREVYIKKVYYM